ncbi:MAG: glutamate racemase [Patescibacteria group bacterium]|jgi:glutamate racemase
MSTYIGIFDSGLGGLHVLQQIVKKLPRYDYLAYSDTANLPYGTKSPAQIYKLVTKALHYLFEHDCALVILACNTASAQALRKIQKQWLPKHFPDRRVLGIVIPTIEHVEKHKGKHIGILATPSTIRSKVFQTEIKTRFPGTQVTGIPTFKLVLAVESKKPKFIQSTLQTLQQKFSGIDILILACTHFGIIAKQIQRVIPPGVKVIVPANALPAQLAAYLKRHPEIERRLSKNRKRTFVRTKKEKPRV